MSVASEKSVLTMLIVEIVVDGRFAAPNVNHTVSEEKPLAVVSKSLKAPVEKLKSVHSTLKSVP